MKRFLITIILLIILTGCKSDSFKNGSSTISNMNQLDEIFTAMMDEGDHNNETQVPYNLVGGVFIYNNGILNLDTLAYNVYSG